MAAQSIQIPSICIPRAMFFITEERFHEVFTGMFGPEFGICDENGYGPSCLKKVDMVAREDRGTSEPYFLVFLHFHPVQRTPEAEYLVDRIEKGETVKVEYDHPWFWKVRKNTGSRKEVRRPRILIEENTDEQPQQRPNSPVDNITEDEAKEAEESV